MEASIPPVGRPKLVVVLSDLHCGSTQGLLPPSFVTLEGNSVEQNAHQRFLWSCWENAKEFIDQVRGENADPYALVLNGDLIEGNHHHTKEIISPEVGDHKAAAIQVLQPLVHFASKTFVVRGTECHTNNTEVSIADSLGAELNPETNNRAFDRLILDVNGTRCVWRHHIGTSVRKSLAATQLSVQLMEERMEAADNGEPMPRVVGFAHRHKYGEYRDGHGIAIVSPPWQLLTRHGHKVVSQARTKPGLYILDFRGKGEGELPEIRKRIYVAPQPQSIIV